MNDKLKNSFESIKDFKNDIENVLKYILNKSDLLENMYNDCLKQIDSIDNYKISLDTFKFQTKLINIEYDNYSKIYNIFFNRMYGDYYKLYKNLVTYIKNEVKEFKIIVNNEYPKYKDLDMNIEYSFNLIDKIYSEILSIILELSNFCLKENYLIKDIEKKQNNGININNFLHEKKYNIVIVEQKIKFYYEVLEGYVNFQEKFCKRLYLKLKLIYSQLCYDINLETSISNNNKTVDLSDLSDSIDFTNLESVEDVVNKNLEINLEQSIDNMSRSKSTDSFQKQDSPDIVKKSSKIIIFKDFEEECNFKTQDKIQDKKNKKINENENENQNENEKLNENQNKIIEHEEIKKEQEEENELQNLHKKLLSVEENEIIRNLVDDIIDDVIENENKLVTKNEISDNSICKPISIAQFMIIHIKKLLFLHPLNFKMGQNI